MIKFKHLFCTVFLSALLYSCGSDSNTVVNFDHAAQALKDKDSIAKFLKTHYYKDDVDSIKPLITGKTALYKDVRLDSVVVNEYGIDYKYYYFIKNTGISSKGNPSVVDSLLTTYRLSSLDNSNKLTKIQDLNTAIWFSSENIQVRGWLHGFTHFKGGKLKKQDDGGVINGPISYEGVGEGFFLLPSGLSYRNQSPYPNKNLLYLIKLQDIVKNTDHDQDGVYSIFEDVDEDGKPWNDDTDKDRIPNYLDTDDDGDGVLTKNEDANGDGDPRNDFSDPSKPTIPDYLNRNIRK